MRSRIGHGLDDVRMRMAGEQRPEAQHVVDEPVSVDVQKVRALASRDEERISAHRPEGANGAVDPAGKQRLGPRELLL